MAGVRLVTTVWAWLGWIMLILGLLGLVSALSTVTQMMSRGGGGNMGALLTGVLAPLIVAALGPFTVWAVLKALCEIHDRGASPEREVQPAPSAGPTEELTTAG